MVHGRTPACRAQKFPEAISFNAAFSNSASASSRFNVLFSRSGLIDQLVFEGFTRPQAEYGVKKAFREVVKLSV